jgi:vitamin B12 transporter
MKKFLMAVAALNFYGQLTAQTADTATLNLDPVVISATKYPLKTSRTGKVVDVITREQIDRASGKDLAQLLTEQTGLYLNGANSNPGKDKSLYLRGARIDHTLITIDGVPVYDPSGIGGNFDIRNIPLYSIERIEILKGSQSTLYGSDAIAGVINIITRRAGQQALNANALLGYGSNNTVRGNAGVGGRSNRFDYSFAYNIHHTKGIDETVSNNPVTDRDGYTQQGIQIGLGIRAGKNLSIRPYLRYTDIRGDLDQGAFTDELDFTYTQRSLQAGVRTELTKGKSRFTLLYNLNRINRVYTDDSVKSRNGFDTYSQGAYKGLEHFADIYAALPLGKLLTLTAGADLRSSHSDQSYSSIGAWGPFSSSYSSDSLQQRQMGVYASLLLQTEKGFSLEAGSRLNMHNEYGSHYVYNINPAYLVSQQVKIFANLSSGYRTPSLYQLYSEYGNRQLRPEAAQTLEGGLQYFGKENRWSARAVYFRRRVKEVIFFAFDPATFRSQYINQDRQLDNGVEMEATLTAAKGVTVKAFYSFVTGNISTLTGAGKDTSYFNLLRRPRHSFGLNVSAQIGSRLSLSSQLLGFGERKDAYFDNQTFQTVQAILGAYLLWDVYGEYSMAKGRWVLFADLRNITNSRYTEVSGFNTLRFNINGGVRWRW